MCPPRKPWFAGTALPEPGCHLDSVAHLISIFNPRRVSMLFELPKLLGKTIRLRRQELGLSQEELAWRAGLNRTYVTDVERGARNLSLSTMDKLAQALRVPLSTLLHEADKARGAVEQSASGEPSQVDILLVEDNPSDADLTVGALRRARLSNSIHLARDGSEALDYLFCTGQYADRKTELRPRLVLLDLKLPRIDGLEVLQRMKADPRTRDIPVVVLTISRLGPDIAQARRLGIEAYIIKPVDFQRLSEVTPKLELSWSLLRLPSFQPRGEDYSARTSRPDVTHSRSTIALKVAGFFQSQ